MHLNIKFHLKLKDDKYESIDRQYVFLSSTEFLNLRQEIESFIFLDEFFKL